MDGGAKDGQEYKNVSFIIHASMFDLLIKLSFSKTIEIPAEAKVMFVCIVYVSHTLFFILF